MAGWAVYVVILTLRLGACLAVDPPQHLKTSNSDDGDTSDSTTFTETPGRDSHAARDVINSHDVMTLGLHDPGDLDSSEEMSDFTDADEDGFNDNYEFNDVFRRSDDNAFWASRGKKQDKGGTIPREPYWLSRGKKGIAEYIPYYWGSNQNMWGKTIFSQPTQPFRIANGQPRDGKSLGWESNHFFWGKRDNGPFWVTRGKKEKDLAARLALGRSWGSNPMNLGKREGISGFPVVQERNNFWLSRGKRSVSASDAASPWPFQNLPEVLEASRGKKEQFRPFWASRGKKSYFSQASSNADLLDLTKPFWVSRGKKNGVAPAPYWVTRGKKESDYLADIATRLPAKPFWISRGKKDSGEAFWAARGKKADDGSKTTREEPRSPYWITRGKKDKANLPPWMEREMKELDTPFWLTRGKKDAAFWAARGKKASGTKVWLPEDDMPFWVVRGKKSQEVGHEGGPFWVVRGRRSEEDNEGELMDVLLGVLQEGAPVEEAPKDTQQPPEIWQGLRGKKNLLNGDETFLALRG